MYELGCSKRIFKMLFFFLQQLILWNDCHVRGRMRQSALLKLILSTNVAKMSVNHFVQTLLEILQLNSVSGIPQLGCGITEILIKIIF